MVPDRSGLDFWLNGIYQPSRPAGYPLNEIMMGGLAWLGGAPACAAAAAAASLAALAYMRWLAPLHGIGDSFWLVLAFSFEPWFWSSGTHDLDYAWGVLALLTALYYTEPPIWSCRLGLWPRIWTSTNLLNERTRIDPVAPRGAAKRGRGRTRLPFRR